MRSSRMKFCTLFLMFLIFHEAVSRVLPVDESVVKRWVVERRKSDEFTVTMKSSSRCYFEWCAEYFSAQFKPGGVVGNYKSCTCTCRSDFPSFIPSMKTCINATQARQFGECNYPYYFDEQTLLAETVDLTRGGEKRFNTSETNCQLRREYYIHDYTGFQASWTLISDGYFTLQLGTGHFNIKWTRRNQALSGRIVRLVVTCSTSFAGCVLLKAKESVTYNAPVSSSVSPSLRTLSSSSLPLPTSLVSSTLSSEVGSLSSSTPIVLNSLVSPLPSSASLKILSSPTSLTMPSASSTLSSHQSLVLTSSTKRTKLSVSSLLPSAQSHNPQLPASSTKEMLSSLYEASNNIASTEILHSSTRIMIHPEIPSKATPALMTSSSSIADVGPGDKGARASGNQNGVVIGAAVGGAVVLGILVFAVVFCKRRMTGKRSEKPVKSVLNPQYGSSDNEFQLETPKESTDKRTPPIVQENNEKETKYQGLLSDSRQTNGPELYSSVDDSYDNCNVYQSLDKQISSTPVYQILDKGLTKGGSTTGLPNSKHITLTNPKLKPSAGGIPASEGNGATGVSKSKSTAAGEPKRGSSAAQDPVYNVLDGPGAGQETVTEPLYNVLEGQDYDAVTVNPLYNVLEGPDSEEGIPGGGPGTTEEAVYNVLEGPNATNSPTNEQGPSENDAIYNVLESPDAEMQSPILVGNGPSKEPLYNVLEEQDGHGSKQGLPKESLHAGAHDNPSYEQTLEFNEPYADVHRPEIQRESVYEPLRRPREDLYEPLA